MAADGGVMARAFTVLFLLATFVVWPGVLVAAWLPMCWGVPALMAILTFFGLVNVLDYAWVGAVGDGANRRRRWYRLNLFYQGVMDVYASRYAGLPRVIMPATLLQVARHLLAGLVFASWFCFFDDGTLRPFWVAISFFVADQVTEGLALLVDWHRAS